MKNQIKIILLIFAIGFSNSIFAKVKLDTITNWQFYKDSKLLFKSHLQDSNKYTAKINSTDNYENLTLSVSYCFLYEVKDRKVELVYDNKIIVTFTDIDNSQIKIPKNVIDTLFSGYLNKEIVIKYYDEINKNGLTIGRLKLFTTEYIVLPVSEIKQIIQTAIDLPELQPYFHTDEFPNRKPLILKEFGLVNSKNMLGIKKFNTDIKILSESDIKKQSLTEYIGIGDWTCIQNTLRLQFYYLAEGITINYIFNKVNSKWIIVDSIILED